MTFYLKKNKNDSIFFIVNFIYISSYFFYSIKDSLLVFNFYRVLLPLEILIIFFIFIFLYMKKIVKEVLFFVFTTNFILIHLLFLEFSLEMSLLSESFIKSFRLFLYLFVTYIFGKYLFDERKFIKILLNLSLIFLWVALFIKLLGLNYLVDTGYLILRPVIFLSEPSAFAPLVAFLIGYSIFYKNLFLFLFSIFSIYIINSGIVICSSLFMLIFILLYKNYKILLFSLIILFISILVFYDLLLEFHSFQRIILIFQTFDWEIGEIGQIRLQTLYNTFIFFKEKGLLFSGMGFNTFLVYFDNKDDFLIRPFSFLHIILQSFGLIGISIYFILIILSLVILINKKEINLYIIFIAFLFSALFNSAEGAIMYKFHILIMVIIFHRYFKLNKKEIK